MKNKNLNPSVTTDRLKNNLSQRKAFSIGEVILSVFILGVTMTTILGLYSSGMRNFQDERDSVIAAALAQEGIELARNVRDNNWAEREGITDVTPHVFDGFNSANASNCRIDIDDSSFTCGSQSKILNLDANNFYVHNSGSATKFRRSISLNFDGANAASSKEVVITSFVSWDGNNPPTTNKPACTVKNKCVFSESTLTDWGTGA